ncbi:hypothetical protein [Klebsiella aerogenes]|uniref:hypothetical protein n=1 Tax=Klebsiella aerogenes TaxID=548 RepID=UPI003CF7E6EB
MKGHLGTLLFALSLTPLWGMANCLSGDQIRSNGQIILNAQASFAHKSDSIWRINGANPYTADNAYNDISINLSSACSFIEDVLGLDFSLYSLGYYAIKEVGLFEQDDHRGKILIDRLKINWSLSDSISFEGGKINSFPGAFHLKSPASLLTSYYAGFKPTRIYDPKLESAYSESYWGGRLAKEFRDYAFSLTVIPKLASIDKYYESSSNWTANQRANSSEYYLLSYTDYRLVNHRLAANIMLGDSPSLALSDGYNLTPQFVVNVEAALHKTQQWRHFSVEKRNEVLSGLYPSSLYAQNDKKGYELAVGGQYTTDFFSVFGIEYYYQSEGYSKSAWREQADFIRLLSKKNGYSSLDQVLDDYKYLMGSEISNTGNKGMLQGRHYITSWLSLQSIDHSTFQPYLVVNLVDGSSLIGAHFVQPLKGVSEQAETYTGLYSALGSRDSEFALFGETLGVYVGFKYYL